MSGWSYSPVMYLNRSVSARHLGPPSGVDSRHVGPELLVAPLGAGHADDGEAVVEHAAVGQAGQGGQDLARR